MGKPPELERCRENPDCGSPVIDRRAHRKWHERVFIAEDSAVKRAGGPRFIGEVEPDVGQGDAEPDEG